MKEKIAIYGTRDITEQDIIQYHYLSDVEDHEEGCLFGHPDGTDDLYKDCDCSADHILKFIANRKARLLS